MMRPRRWLGVVALMGSLQLAASAAEIAGPLVHEAVISAPVAAVWAAFTTREGQEAWMVAHADIELKVGGRMRAHYDRNGTLGDAKTIENTIISFDPQHMLSMKVAKPPEGFPFPNAVGQMWTVVYFTAEGAATTRVRIVGLGFGEDDEAQKMRAFFDRGNAWTLKKLQDSFTAKKSGE